MNSTLRELYEYADNYGFAKGNFRTDNLIAILEHYKFTPKQFIDAELLNMTVDELRQTENESGYLDTDLFDHCLGYILFEIDKKKALEQTQSSGIVVTRPF